MKPIASNKDYPQRNPGDPRLDSTPKPIDARVDGGFDPELDTMTDPMVPGSISESTDWIGAYD